MDFDDDGIQDIISGCYDPGELYWFPGKGYGEFAARQTLVDKEGNPILRKQDQEQTWESFGSWVDAVDWDNDGDLDLVLGGLVGDVFVRINDGTRAKPEFGTENVFVTIDGEDLVVPGHHATPVIADWDGDGLWDLLSGSANGAVYWYRNVGKLGSPEFASPVTLVKEHTGSGFDEFLDIDDEPLPGVRSQISVTDYNGDGKLDLLLGDFVTNVSPRPDMTTDERGKMLVVRDELLHLEERLTHANLIIDDALDRFLKEFSADEVDSDEVQNQWRQKRKTLRSTVEYKQIKAAWNTQKKSFQAHLAKSENPTGFEEYSTCHGYVWLFLRR